MMKASALILLDIHVFDNPFEEKKIFKISMDFSKYKIL